MEYEKYEDGVPSWVDMSAPDVEQSKTFYAGLLGWETPEGPPDSGGYSVCLLRGKTVAGLSPRFNPDSPPAWVTYVNVDDADATIAKVKASGGMVFVEPMDVIGAGRMAIFADPLGAVIGLWQPGNHMGAELVNEPGTYCWSELVTTDLDVAKTFYRSVFGWDGEDQGPPGGPVAYTEWKLGGRSVGGMMLKNENMPAEMPPSWGVYFAVDDCDGAVARAQELGATLFHGPMDIEPGRFAILSDPQGAVFSVMSLKAGIAPS